MPIRDAHPVSHGEPPVPWHLPTAVGRVLAGRVLAGSAMVSPMRGATAVSPSAAPGTLPPPGHPERWSVLQGLRRQRALDPQPWLAAIEAGSTPLQSDLIAVLAPHLDGAAAVRLLECWLQSPQRDPAIPPLLGERRDRLWAARLRQALEGCSDDVAVLLLPLLGHQREASDFLRLRRQLLDPAPLALRLAALEALCCGLSCWPLAPLRRALAISARDLQPRLAAAALDALARLPAARSSLMQLAAPPLAAELETRRQRRLSSLPVSPLLLLVHGRAGGELPAELQELAAELTRRRGSPVTLQGLTSPESPELSGADPEGEGSPLTLVPLLLFPGNHVRQDLPRLARGLRQRAPLRRRPFLGAWRAWQEALADEVAAIRAAAPQASATPPSLLHHPLEGPLAQRYLTLLSKRCAARSQAADPGALPPGGEAILPLALAANRLTESLQAAGWDAAACRPLLARERLRQVLLELLLQLP